MRYSDHVDYLISSIIYLGTHEFYWARSPEALAKELSLDEHKLGAVFDGFPGIFRKSRRLSSTGQSFYALQARYAQREGDSTGDPEQTSYIAPIDSEKLKLLLDFILKMTEHEKTDHRTRWSNALAIVTAIFSAITSILVATEIFKPNAVIAKAGVEQTSVPSSTR